MFRRRGVQIAIAAVVLIALAVVALFVVFPAGSSSSDAAVKAHVKKKTEVTPEVLVQQDWGSGQLVLVGYDRRSERKLGLAFVRHATRGWRVNSYTEQTVDPSDVVVGSLLVASSEAGSGQPAWSAAVGEVTDPRIDRVEITWSNGQTSIGSRTGDAYLVVERGTTSADAARFLSKDGNEIAKVPIKG